jgi:F-type H+-transporting ATPase subunit b
MRLRGRVQPHEVPMNVLSILLQEHAAEGAEPGVFQLAANVSFWTVVIFLALLALLAKFAFPPILGYAAAREKRIQDSLDEAKKQREEAAALLAQQRQELGVAKQEAQQVILEARQAAEKVRGELLNKARQEQEEILARAKQEIAVERERAVESVRREAVDLALAAAGKLIERKLDADDDRRLVSEFLGRAAN